MQGLFKSINHLTEAAKVIRNQGLEPAKPLGVIPSKFNGRKTVQHQNLGYMRGKLGSEMILDPIRFLTDWEKASQRRLPVTVYASRSGAAKDARAFVNSVLNRVEEVQHA